MRRNSLRGLSLTLAAFVAAHAAAARAVCADWNPLDSRVASASRPVTVEELMGLVNFGRPDGEPMGDASSLAISPDGRRVAFVLQRADLATNRYCQVVVVIDIDGKSPPRVLDRGGDFIMAGYVFRNIYSPIGAPRLNTPAWSGDGTAVAYLRRDAGSTQLWRARLDGSSPAQITHAAVDVDAWSWAADGHSLLYATSPARLDAERAIAMEGLDGWHFDTRFEPVSGMRPQPAVLDASVSMALDPDTGRTRPLTQADAALLSRDRSETFTDPRLGSGGERAWLERAGQSPLSPRRLVIVRADRVRVPCGTACEGALIAMWWNADHSLSFLRQEGWNQRYTALYRWRPGRDRPFRLLRSDDLIQGCRPAGGLPVCIREAAGAPPRLVSLDPRSGAQRVLFDPNPTFPSLTLGTVERLTWRNAFGREVYGDLVLPPGDRHGPLPTIVVQYRSQGFLRGGIGNEYPIYLFAQRGFAVLSVQAPALVAASDPMVRTEEDIGRVNTRNWGERRNAFSAIASGLRLVVSRGIADPKRLGITGLSDGASTVRFGIINSKLFAAAALSTCCVDESADTLAGPAWAAFSRKIGYPPAYPLDRRFWQAYSLVLNADRVDTPLLMQLADSEALTALPSATALAAYHQPVDVYVYPDEYHIKWQPRHRRAVFERDLDWFSFWLQGRVDPVAAKIAQFDRWRSLQAARAAMEARPSAGP